MSAPGATERGGELRTRRSERNSLREKTLRVARLLEDSMGTPTLGVQRPAPVDMLIATILSQNTNDKNSHRAYAALRKKYPTWSALARASTMSIESTIRIGGMAHQKARRIKDIVRRLDQEDGGFRLSELYTMRDDEVMGCLTRFKGVGVKTAACVLLFSLGRDVFPVDTHIHRICSRLGLTAGSGLPEHTFEIMKSLVAPGKAYSFHTNLIRFGRSICRSNNPRCEICPLYGECTFEGKSRRQRRQRGPSKADHNFMLLDNIVSSQW